MKTSLRVGTGFDAHALGEGIPLYLGGILIPHEKGLIGHSDGDVLIHALVDAVFGALGIGDLGEHFSSSDLRWKGARSLDFLSYTRQRLNEHAFEIIHADMTVIAQRPVLRPFIPVMQNQLAKTLECDESRLSIKATTTDHLGFTGREEGIAAQAICLLGPSGAKY